MEFDLTAGKIQFYAKSKLLVTKNMDMDKSNQKCTLIQFLESTIIISKRFP